MINEQLLQPKSIVVIGGSNNVHKPGGSIVRNLINGDYQGELRIVNPKEDTIQGIKAFHDVKDIPQTDLAILVVAAKYCPDYVDYLCAEKGVKVDRAGFEKEMEKIKNPFYFLNSFKNRRCRIFRRGDEGWCSTRTAHPRHL